MPMDIIKRNGSTEAYERRKIARVIERAFASVESTIAAEKLNLWCPRADSKTPPAGK